MSDFQIAELLQQGIAAAKAGRTEEARQALMQVVDWDEENEQAWLWLSGVVESLEDRRVCLANVLALNPDNTHAQAGLRWLEQHSPPPSAVEDDSAQEEVLAAGETSAEVPSDGQDRCPHCGAPVPQSGTECPYCNQPLIVACPTCGQYVNVEQTSCPDCGRPLGDFHEGAAYHLALAQAYLDGRKLDRALASLEHAQADAPDEPQVLQTVAALYEKAGRTDLAIAAYKQALEHAPNDAAVYARLGALYRLSAKPSEARAMYEKARQLKGNDPVILTELARLHVEEEGPDEEARSLLQRATKLDPGYAEAHLLLGDVNASQGYREEAVRQYESAGRLAPPNSAIGLEASRKLTSLARAAPYQTAGRPGAKAKRGRSRPRERPGCLTLYAILVILGGLLGTLGAVLGGIGVFLGSGAIEELVGPWAEMGIPIPVTSLTMALLISIAIALFMSVLNLAVGIGLWNLKNWARIVTIVLQTLGMLGNVAQAVLSIGSFGLVTSGADLHLQFPTTYVAILVFALLLQGYIIFWFAVNGDLFD
jgi:tetratricopeptide (TPR) repeat protein